MIDAEVMRLRRLRNRVLRARALAVAMGSDLPRRSSVYARGAVTCWRIACIVTGRLRAHPYVSYQRGPGALRAAHDMVSAWAGAALARHRGRTLQTYAQALQLAAAELDDARALTWSGDLSDTFGRLQRQLRRLIDEVESGARQQAGAALPAARTEGRSAMSRQDAGSLAGNWPYLAF
ncbi:MAG TPA: hypothetical protein VN692_18385 [Steroidobacteraceae bacterium]|nr:hypothetical protein [Steroidobacteraceae bacterium]